MIRKKKLIIRIFIIICILTVVYRINGVKLHKKGDFDFDGPNSFSTENMNKIRVYVYLKYLGEKITLEEIIKESSNGKKEKRVKDVVDNMEKYELFNIPTNIDYVKKCLDNKIPVLVNYVLKDEDKEKKHYMLLVKGYNSISGKFRVLSLFQLYNYESGLRFGFGDECESCDDHEHNHDHTNQSVFDIYYDALKKSLKYDKLKEFKIDEETLQKYLDYYGGQIITKKYSPFYESESTELRKYTENLVQIFDEMFPGKNFEILKGKQDKYLPEKLRILKESIELYTAGKDKEALEVYEKNIHETNEQLYGYHYAVMLFKNNKVEKLSKHAKDYIDKNLSVNPSSQVVYLLNVVSLLDSQLDERDIKKRLLSLEKVFMHSRFMIEFCNKNIERYNKYIEEDKENKHLDENLKILNNYKSVLNEANSNSFFGKLKKLNMTQEDVKKRSKDESISLLLKTFEKDSFFYKELQKIIK